MYTTLARAKEHLNIEMGYTGDDDYISSLIEASEDAVSVHIGNNLADILITGGTGTTLPPAVSQAILLLVGNFYANRETAAFAKVEKIPLSYEYLLSLYKNYQ